MNVSEELLDLQSLKDRRRGTDLFVSVCFAVDDIKRPWNKVTGIITGHLPRLASKVDYQHWSATKAAKKEAKP